MFKTIAGGMLPERATTHSAGFDVFSNEDKVVYQGQTALIGLGVAIDTNKTASLTDLYFELHPRSSMRLKGITSLGTGIIDIDYPDEIKMVVHNTAEKPLKIARGDKIGQLILCKHFGSLMPCSYTKNAVRVGGFGSTGDK